MDDDPIVETQDAGLGVSRLLRKYSPTPFLIYRQRQLPHLQKQNPQAKVADLVKILQVQWKEEDSASIERIQCTSISDMIRGQLRECLHHAVEVSSWLSARHDMKQAMVAVGVRSPKFFRHLGPFGANEAEQKKNFHEAWRVFSPNHVHIRIPSFARQKIDLFNLYRSVVSLGGFEHVSERQLWDTVVNRQGLDSVCTPTDKAAVMILRIAYFTLLLDFELQYQFAEDEEKSSIPNVPVHPTLTLPISPYTPSNFSSNHYRQPGMTTILFSLRSRLCSCVCWALNHLLLISYNQNRPILLSDYPALLEILVALLERQLLVVDLSGLGARASLPHLAQYATSHQTISHNVVFPEITPILLVILQNLAHVAANQPRIAQHHSCAGDLLDCVFQHDIAGDILLLVAQYLDVSKLSFTNLSRWLHKSLQTVESPSVVIRALEMLGILCLNAANHAPLTTQLHIEVYHLVVSLLCYPDNDDVLIAVLETLAKLTSVGGTTFAIRIVGHTSIIDRLMEPLLRPIKENDANDVVIRRTASQILAELYAPEDNRVRFRPYLSSMFLAINKNFEVGALLAPILRVSAQAGR